MNACYHESFFIMETQIVLLFRDDDKTREDEN